MAGFSPERTAHIASRSKWKSSKSLASGKLAMPHDAPTTNLDASRRVIAEWPRNSRETIRVSLGEYQGHPTIDVRVWFDPGDGRLRPGKPGNGEDATPIDAVAA